MSVATEKTRAKSGGLGETVKIVIQALLLALIVRTFLFQPFNIPSGSMKSTLLVGDYLFVSKYAYGYSRYSLPLRPAPLRRPHLGRNAAERGDIVVFKLPRDNSTDYIKRVIGLPGDKIQMIDGVLYINGAAGQARAGRRLRHHRRVRRRDARRPLPGDAAQRRQLPDARSRSQRLRGQHPGLRGAARPLSS